jgi:uncharacterized protein (TIGR03083 family)
MSVRAEVQAERAALAESLEILGPLAPTACGSWTAFDLGAHVVASERAGGALAFGVRILAGRGVPFKPDPRIVDLAIARQRREGFEALVARLHGRCPRLLLARPVAASTLFEVWMHHDDLTSANNRAHSAPPHLALAIPSLLRYQTGRLPDARLVVRSDDGDERVFGSDRASTAVLSGSTPDLVRWLAGRRPDAAPHIEASPELTDRLRAFRGRVG